jgi:hypothetical protein
LRQAPAPAHGSARRFGVPQHAMFEVLQTARIRCPIARC